MHDAFNTHSGPIINTRHVTKMILPLTTTADTSDPALKIKQDKIDCETGQRSTLKSRAVCDQLLTVGHINKISNPFP